jgi:hypothetical protein
MGQRGGQVHGGENGYLNNNYFLARIGETSSVENVEGTF